MRRPGWLTFGKGGWATFGRQGLLPLAAVLIGFLAGVHLFFPTTAVLARLQAEVANRLPPGVTVELPQLTLRFPLRFCFDGVVVQTGVVGMAPVIFDRIELRPTLATLLARPGVRVDARGANGRLAGEIAFSGAVDLQLTDGRFDLPMPPSQLRLSGEIPKATLSGFFPLGPQSSLQARLNLNQLILHGGQGLGLAAAELPLGHLDANIDGAGRRLQLRQATLAGGAVQLEATGEILAQTSLPASRIDLALQLRLPAESDPALRGLFDLLGTPAADGLYRLRLQGPLANPTLK